MKKILSLFAVLAMLTSCLNPVEKEKIIGPHDITLESDVMTPEVLWAFGRVSDIQVSPDQSKVLFGITWYDWQENKGNRDLYIMNIDGTNKVNITNTNGNEYNARWKNNEEIGFLAVADDGTVQLFEMNIDGSGRKQISAIEGGITGFSYSPDLSAVAYIKEIPNKTCHDLYPDLDKADARIIDDLMFRHWDIWVTSTSHLFIADYNGLNLTNHVDVLEGEPYETPMMPFGGMEQITWAPDGKSIVYTCRKKTGLAYSLSTNSDLYQYFLETGKIVNLTEGMHGYDMNPVFSPDGTKLAWESMERDGYESDKQRLFVMDMATGETVYHTKNFDQHVFNLRWSNDASKIYFVSGWHGTQQLYEINLKNDSIKRITDGVHNYEAFELAGDKFIAQRQSMSMPSEIYAVNITDGAGQNISNVNTKLLNQLTMGNVEERWITTTDGKKMLTWVIYPPHFDPNKKYPTLLYCQGGPQSMVGQFWSYRWNFQMMAANGYIVVAPNRRGVPGFGQEWLEQISGDYGGQNMKDYLTAIDTLAAEPFVDEDNLGAVGASYGGFSVYWLAGNHEGRFKAFIAHDGMFNLESQYLETDELWFTNWDLGGPFWEKDNAIAQRSYENSPHKFVDKWDTPILIIHGERDYRIPYTQAIQAFTAAKILGVPARLLIFPTENHWVLQPQNAILWQREFKGWLDKWLKGN